MDVTSPFSEQVNKNLPADGQHYSSLEGICRLPKVVSGGVFIEVWGLWQVRFAEADNSLWAAVYAQLDVDMLNMHRIGTRVD